MTPVPGPQRDHKGLAQQDLEDVRAASWDGISGQELQQLVRDLHGKGATPKKDAGISARQAKRKKHRISARQAKRKKQRACRQEKQREHRAGELEERRASVLHRTTMSDLLLHYWTREEKPQGRKFGLPGCGLCLEIGRASCRERV